MFPTHPLLLPHGAIDHLALRRLALAAGVVAAAEAGFLGLRRLDSTAAPHVSSIEQFGGRVDRHEGHIGFEINLAGGSMLHVSCARGARPGTTCWLANGAGHAAARRGR
jgi:hypothetical protein